MEIYLVRHGETIWNKERRYYGHEDVGLSEVGFEQAKKLGSFFKKISFHHVICSPLKRAVDTARQLTDQKLELDERLMEQNFGQFEGKTYEELRQLFPDELTLWNRDYENYCLPDGESFRQVRDRVEDFVNELWKMDGRILIVAHKGTFGHMLAAMMQLPLSAYWNFVFEQGTYSKVDLQDGFAIVRTINRIPTE